MLREYKLAKFRENRRYFLRLGSAWTGRPEVLLSHFSSCGRHSFKFRYSCALCNANASFHSPTSSSASSEKTTGRVPRARIFKQSVGARNRVEIGLSYGPARLHRLAKSIPGLHNRLKMLALSFLTWGQVAWNYEMELSPLSRSFQC